MQSVTHRPTCVLDPTGHTVVVRCRCQASPRKRAPLAVCHCSTGPGGSQVRSIDTAREASRLPFMHRYLQRHGEKEKSQDEDSRERVLKAGT